jgi:acyl-CoA synthetase (AMP-forming)/AMP-acid ligase II
VIFGGENMPAKVLNVWRRKMPDTRFINVYGPTETTVDSTYYVVDRDLKDGENVPIGYPCRDTEILLLDENKKPVPQGEPGEIYIRGAGVGLGYCNDRERTAAVFMQNPRNDKYHDIIYRTGDIARLNEYGELVFVNRADNQVKHMGSRVELGEVETVAAGLDGIDLVCCAYDKENLKILMFYEGSIAEKALAAELSTRLPRYMCPNVIVKITTMPKLPNGKMDRLHARKEYYDTKL